MRRDSASTMLVIKGDAITAGFIWVKGHNGHEFNERCDEMAVASANGENLLDDTGCIQ